MSDSTELFEEIADLKRKWDAAQPLSAENERRLWKKLRLEWNYNSNHIEGNTLTYGETELLLLHGKTTGTHDVREYEEMKAHNVAIDHVQKLATEDRFLQETDIRDLNRIILKEPFWKEALTSDGESTRKQVIPGDYKTTPNNVRTATGEMFEFATPIETPAKMEELLSWLEKSSSLEGREFLERCADFHHRFAVIHPFDDGNGRVARLVLNYLLLRHGYVPIVILTGDKRAYLTALQRADAGDPEPFQIYVAERVRASLGLGCAAANGASIDEPDDLDKEVELFVAQRRKDLGEVVTKSREAIDRVLSESVNVLIARVKARLQPLSELFAEMLIDVKPVGVHVVGSGGAADWGRLVPVVPQDTGLEIQIKFTGYKGPTKEQFVVASAVRVMFRHTDYQISFEDQELATISYQENLDSQALEAISRVVVERIFELVKEKTASS